MSRSGYSDDLDSGALNLYRANVGRTIRGKVGQAFLRELVVALDAMPAKRLIDGDLIREDGNVCAIGAICRTRGLDVRNVDDQVPQDVAKAVGISRILAAEIAYENDEHAPWQASRVFQVETPEERWERMRAWTVSKIERF